MKNQINIFEVLMDAICCVMCADRKITTREREAVHKILEKTKAPWDHDEVNDRINVFIERVKKQGLDSVIQKTCEKIPEFKRRGKEDVLLRCIDYMMRADRHIDESEKKLCDEFRSVLEPEGEIRPAAKDSPDHLLLLLDREPASGQERYLQHVIREFFPQATFNANVVVTPQIKDETYIVAMAIGIAEKEGFELDEERVSWRNSSTSDGVNATIVSIYRKTKEVQSNDRTECPFYCDGDCNAGGERHRCTLGQQGSYASSCRVYKFVAGPAGLRTCSVCGVQWRSMYGALMDNDVQGIFGPNKNVSVTYDLRNLKGLTCIRCKKSFCRKHLSQKIPATLPGGRCPSCEAALNIA